MKSLYKLAILVILLSLLTPLVAHSYDSFNVRAGDDSLLEETITFSAKQYEGGTSGSKPTGMDAWNYGNNPTR